jgi:sporulation-control protein
MGTFVPMVFKRMLGALGVGGLSVDTVLSDPNATPGGPVSGRVDLVGGSHEAAIEHVTLGLIARLDVEGGAAAEFDRFTVSGAMRLAPEERVSLPFQFSLPWETPVTTVHGQPLRGMVMGVRTEVAIAKAVDKGDLDLIQVHPLPLQQRILDAFGQLGFVVKGADLEYGQIRGVAQTLPFHQEIEHFAAPQIAHLVKELELTFVTDPHGVEIVLEFDKRGGRDSYGRYAVPHGDADTVDWTQQVDAWVRLALDGAGGGAHGGYHGHYRQGPGMGGLAMGVAGGVAAGYVAGEVLDDVFEDGFEGEE